ncbi:MAG: hypothetical protein HQM13_01885 [SAR324 cluster bacterium]|nr:hypothetical protein [SAR324 cluster bacterium]
MENSDKIVFKKMILKMKKLSFELSRNSCRILLLGMLLFGNRGLASAQQTEVKCGSYQAFVKCKQEELKKSSASRGTTEADARAATYKLRSTEFRDFIDSENKRQKHLKTVQADSYKSNERIVKGVEKIIAAHKRRQAYMRSGRQ